MSSAIQIFALQLPVWQTSIMRREKMKRETENEKNRVHEISDVFDLKEGVIVRKR